MIMNNESGYSTKTYVELLKEARELVKNGSDDVFEYESRFICTAIEYVAELNKENSKGIELQDWINEMLEGYISLRGWLQDNLGHYVTYEEVNAHRVLWLDKLIKEYENE